MITPESCEERKDGYDHGHHDDNFKTDTKVIEVISLNQSF